MQFLNDDMEELYRRAGEDYPLNTKGANWQKVQQTLQPEAVNMPLRNKRDYRYLWLLVFLPFVFICGRYSGNNTAGDGASMPGNTETNLDSKAITDTSNSTTSNPAKRIAIDRNQPLVNTTGKVHKGQLQPGRRGRTLPTVVQQNNATNAAPIARLQKSKVEPPTHGFKSTKGQPGNTTGKPWNSAPNKAGIAPPDSIIQNTAETQLLDTAPPGTRVLPYNQPAGIDSTTPGKINNAVSKPKHLYYAITIAPDISIVKSAKFSKVGYTAGLLIGYQPGKKIRLETGLMWSKKNYYADGEYMDTGRLKLPSHSTIMYAEGACNMFEIPVTIQYDIYTGAQNSVFVAGSLHSYLMKKEGYNIAYKRYNVNYASDYIYINTTKNWFAIAGISAGYRKLLKNKSMIGFAPFVKLPLRGIGVGKLPVASTGINITLSNFIR